MITVVAGIESLLKPTITFAPLCVYVYVNVLRYFRLILVTGSDALE